MSEKILSRGAVLVLTSAAAVLIGSVCAAGTFSTENVNGEAMVRDSKAGIEWLQNTADVNRDGSISEAPFPEGDMVNWEQAKKFCYDLEFGGYRDWRLPELDELLTLVDNANSYPAIDPVFKCEGSYYWSATPSSEEDNAVMYVHFNFGTDHWMPKDKKAFVRCVRRIKK